MLIILILAILAVVYGIVGAVIAHNNKNSKPNEAVRELPAHSWALRLSVPTLILLFIYGAFIVDIDAQEVGVVVTPTGIDDRPLYTGWHLIAPWNKVKRMDRTVWVYTLTKSSKEGAKSTDDAIWAPTSDGIKMGFDISVNWRIDPKSAPWILQNISADQDGSGKYLWIEENIIRPAIKSVMPLTISNYTPIQCYSDKRSEIQSIVQKELIRELSKNHLIVEVAQIREVYYNPQYEQSINQKKLEEQKVFTLIQVTRQKQEQLKQAEIDKDMAIATAEGEAKSLQIKGNAINANPKIIQLEWINKWDGKLPTYQMGSGTGVIMNMPNGQ